MGRFIDLTGMKFGRWTVINKTDKRTKSGGVLWECVCECSPNIVHLVQTASLKNGTSKSCGCLQKEASANSLRKLMTKHNRYDLSGDYGIGYTFKGEEFYFDLEDYDNIKDYCWCLDANGYVVTNKKKDSNDSHGTILMHRLIMDCIEDKISVDHINHVQYDNRKDNLRLTTQSQNTMNRSLGKNNKSGVTGVYFDNHSNKWAAEIKINRKKISLGHFKEFNDAVAARKEAEEKYFGEFSYDNSVMNTA